MASLDKQRVNAAHDRAEAEPCTLEHLLENSDFRTRHEAFCGNDAVLGTILCLMSLWQGRFHAVLFSNVGGLVLFDEEPDTELYKTIQAPALRNVDLAPAVATALQIHLERIPVDILSELESSTVSDCDTRTQHVLQIVSSLRQIKDISIPSSLLQFLAVRYPHTVDIDFIVEEESELMQLLPRAIEIQDRHAELHKVPSPPAIENEQKRDNLIHELLATERTYVGRLQHLVRDYALPLRAASRKQRGLIGSYETNTLFPSSLDAILLLNEDLLKSLEAADGEFDFALVLARGFQDFRKIYSRYLETSAALDGVLRSALKVPKFKEFTDQVRSTANANIGIRELVMEPISRIPRYSLLISSLLAVMTPKNSAYEIFREALLTVRMIGFMERDETETSRETLMKLAGIVSSWPADLVRSSVTIVAHIDCLDLQPLALPDTGSSTISNQGHLCSVVLSSDRLIFLKRAKNYKMEEVMTLNKRGELGYRGYILLEDVILTTEDNCLNLLLLKEVSGISSAKWISRPFRRLAVGHNDLTRFGRSFENCKAMLKGCSTLRYVEPYQELQIRYHVYNRTNWLGESENRKSMIRVWQDCDDNCHSPCCMRVTINQDSSFSCSAGASTDSEMLCNNVHSLSILKDVILEKAYSIHKKIWLKPGNLKADVLMAINQAFSTSLMSANTASNRVRPVSPSKLVASILGRMPGDSSMGRPSTSAKRPLTAIERDKNQSATHSITKKKSNPLFNFGNDNNKCFLGVDTFVESLLKFEQFASQDLSPLNANETKEASTLASSISKDPKKGFAILGSPSKIALHAFKLYCRSILSKKLGGSSILSEALCTDLRAHLRYDHEVKLARMRSVLKTTPRLNLGLLKSVLTFAVHLLRVAPADAKIPALLLASEMIVPPLMVTSFISTLEVLIEDFEAFFVVHEDQLATIDSRTSCMTLPNISSQFGSVSSMSHFYGEVDASTLLTSPTKQSYYSLTPDLIHDISSPDGPSSLFRSPSGSSVTTSLNSDRPARYKRSTIHVEKPSRHQELVGLRAASAELPASFAFDDNTLEPPRADYSLPRSQSDQVTYTLSSKPMLEVTTSPSPLIPPDTPGLMSNFDLKSYNDQRTEVPRPAEVQKAQGQPQTGKSGQHASLTPSKIPIASPRVTPTHSRETSYSGPTLKLTSKKESSLPRLPSVLAKRRESRQLSKTYDEGLAHFDPDLAADYCNMLRFNETMPDESAEDSEDGKEHETFLRKENDSPLPTHDRVAMRREITAPSKISSSATVRRVSRQLQLTNIGPLDDVPAAGNAQLGKFSGSPKSQASSWNAGCTSECHEAMELLKLELDHYKAIYRTSVEEVDVTLDLANEQIEELQQALEAGSLEACAMRMLELEKEENRKLRLELAKLAEQY